jgi:hypothetical protein
MNVKYKKHVSNNTHSKQKLAVKKLRNTIFIIYLQK